MAKEVEHFFHIFIGHLYFLKNYVFNFLPI
jgi:hypothetical protein